LISFYRDGFVTLQEYMAFMISKETENVQSSEEIEMAFRAITSQVLTKLIIYSFHVVSSSVADPNDF
jgi:hypothetical protein